MKAEGNRNVTLGSFIVDPASRSLKPWGMGRVGISPLSSWRVPITRNETRSHRSNLIAPIARHREVPKRDAWVWAGFASPKHWRSRALPHSTSLTSAKECEESSRTKRYFAYFARSAFHRTRNPSRPEANRQSVFSPYPWHLHLPNSPELRGKNAELCRSRCACGLARQREAAREGVIRKPFSICAAPHQTKPQSKKGDPDARRQGPFSQIRKIDVASSQQPSSDRSPDPPSARAMQFGVTPGHFSRSRAADIPAMWALQ